jgi:hypothetical protein
MTISLAVALFAISAPASAYSIGGQYATLVSCHYGQLGYQYGNIGTYQLGNRQVDIFFGSSYCPS